MADIPAILQTLRTAVHWRVTVSTIRAIVIQSCDGCNVHHNLPVSTTQGTFHLLLPKGFASGSGVLDNDRRAVHNTKQSGPRIVHACGKTSSGLS